VHVAFIGTRGVPASYSGFETCVEQVGRRMVERGHEVTVYCRTTHYRERPPEYLGMQLRYLPAIPQKHLETISHTTASALRLPKQSAIVCMGVGNAPAVRAIEVGGRRTVFNVDGADWQRDKWGALARWYLRTCESMAARSRSIVVADAEAVHDYYQNVYGRDTVVVPYGADAPADRGTDVLQRFRLEPGCYFLFVGRLVPENGAHELLDAVRLSSLDVPVVVVGDATYAEEYKAQLKAASPPGAVFTGYQFGASYQQLSSHAAVFVLAASVGGTHPVLLEQMAAGNAILARDNTSNREVLGDAGLYWNTVPELAALMKELWSEAERRKHLGEEARRRVEERYSWEKVTSQYLELCERSLAQ